VDRCNTRRCQEVWFPISFTWVEVSVDRKSTPISLDISPLFSHIVSKLVQAFVIIYVGIFQALALQGDVLLPKPFLDPAPSTVQPRLGPLFSLTCLEHRKNISSSHFWTSALNVSSGGNYRARRCFFSLSDTWESKGAESGLYGGGGGVPTNGFGSSMSPSTARAWKNSSYITKSAWTSLEIMWKNRELMSEDIRMFFLCPFTCIHLKRNVEPYFLTSPHNFVSPFPAGTNTHPH
jgi:hypothetical protein